jgi:formylglycine-generating enzyme required for sulfatase activity
VSKLAAEDRCHLNGLALANGRPRFVTAVSMSDVVDGWRDRRREGGIMTWRFTNMKLKANYLSLTGYRLPTEAEMEYAIRAGALTSRYYGETAELLPKYAWYDKNSQEKTWPVGSLKPNDWGLFDVQGNVFTWCQERYNSYPQSKVRALEDKEDINSINNSESRVLRGGSFFFESSSVRSSSRSNYVPADRDANYGFRPARTYR